MRVRRKWKQSVLLLDDMTTEKMDINAFTDNAALSAGWKGVCADLFPVASVVSSYYDTLSPSYAWIHLSWRNFVRQFSEVNKTINSLQLAVAVTFYLFCHK